MVRFLFSVCASILILSLTATAIAETEEPNSIRLRVVIDLDDAQLAEAEAAWIVVRDRLETAGYPFYTVISEHRDKRLLVSVLNEYEALQTVEDFAGDFLSTEDTELKAAVSALSASVQSMDVSLTRSDRDLSYVPPGSYAGPFHELTTYSFAARDRAQMSDLLARKKALWSDAGIAHAFHVMWPHSGPGVNSVTVMTSATDPQMHRSIFSAVEADLAPEAREALNTELTQLITQRETVTWVGRTDLRVFPLHMRTD